MKKYFFILFIGLSVAATAQEDEKTWLNYMNNRYQTATSMSMHFQADYYSTTIQSTPTTSMKGEVRFNGTNYYSDAMGEIVLSNKKYMLLIDKTQHTITCLPGSKNNTSSVATGQPDSSWLAASKLKFLTNSGTSRRIEISGNDPVYEKTEVTINATTYELEQIVFYYKKIEDGSSPKLVVKYSNVKFNTGLSDADFSEKKYIQKKDGKILAAPAYSTYKVIDLMKGPVPNE